MTKPSAYSLIPRRDGIVFNILSREKNISTSTLIYYARFDIITPCKPSLYGQLKV
jgi:hypothetical protein